jgi:hypothetical protein
MDKCNNEFSYNFNTKFNKENKSVFIGALDEEGKIKEEKCKLDNEYAKCRIYLDTLTRMKKLIILFYTRGHLSRIINKYNRGLIIIDTSISLSSSKYDIYDTIIDFIKYRYKLKVNENDFYKQYFDKIIRWMSENLLETITSIIDMLNTDNYDPDNFIFNIEDIDTLQQIKINYNTILSNEEKYKMIIKLFLDSDEISYSLINYLLDLYFDKNIAINKEYFDNLDKDINSIINNAPPTDRCVRLFRAADNYKEYKIGQRIINDTIISTSCSQKTNIYMFNKSDCCIAEFILKPGIKALFLNYEETAFGEAMYEVILQKNLTFEVIKIEEKDIIDLVSIQDVIENSNYEIKKIVNISYEQPTKYSFKKINSFLFKQI